MHGSESADDDDKKQLMWALLAGYLPNDVHSIKKEFVHNAEFLLTKTR